MWLSASLTPMHSGFRNLLLQLLNLEWHCLMMLINPSPLLRQPGHQAVHQTMSRHFCLFDHLLYSYLQLCWCVSTLEKRFLHVDDKVLALFDPFLCIYFLTGFLDNPNYEKLIILCRSVFVIPIILHFGHLLLLEEKSKSH